MRVDDEPEERRMFKSPVDLLVPGRFDIAAKCIYARWKDEKRQSDWGRTVYASHVLVINGGVERRTNPLKPATDFPKIGLDKFYSSYDDVLESVKHRGFDATKAALPVSSDGILMDGAHRAAACIYYKKPLVADSYAIVRPFNYNYDYFDKRGLDADALDFMVLEYVILRPDCYMLLVWPSAEKYISQIRQMIIENTQVVCEKKIKIANKQMPINIVQQVYSGENWLFDKYGRISGRKKSAYCFSGGDSLYVVVLCADSIKIVSALKDNIRKLAGAGKHSVHSTEDKEETVRLAQLFFNRNSLHHLTYSRPIQSAGFWEKLSGYKQVLPTADDNFCLHGSAVMEAYGIREARDFDYVSLDGVEVDFPNLDVSLSNEKPKLAGMSINEAIEDPRNYFHYYGVKFASLQAVVKMKQNRGERKDRRDVRMINRQVYGGFSLNPIPALWQGWLLWYKRRNMRRKIKVQQRLLKNADKGHS